MRTGLEAERERMDVGSALASRALDDALAAALRTIGGRPPDASRNYAIAFYGARLMEVRKRLMDTLGDIMMAGDFVAMGFAQMTLLPQGDDAIPIESKGIMAESVKELRTDIKGVWFTLRNGGWEVFIPWDNVLSLVYSGEDRGDVVQLKK